jgi:hypothetical protein
MKSFPGVESIEFLNWSFTWFKASNSSAFVRYEAKELDSNKLSAFSYSPQKKGTITLKYKRKEELGGQTYERGLDYTGTLFIKAK